MDIEPKNRTLGLEGPQEEGDPSPSSAEKGDRREESSRVHDFEKF